MHISEAIYRFLIAVPEVSALVSDRIFRVLIDQDAERPLLQLQLRGNTAQNGLRLTSPRTVQYEISAWGESQEQAQALIQATEDALLGLNNQRVPASTPSLTGLFFMSVLLEDEQEQAVKLAPDVLLVRIVQSYQIQYRS